MLFFYNGNYSQDKNTWYSCEWWKYVQELNANIEICSPRKCFRSSCSYAIPPLKERRLQLFTICSIIWLHGHNRNVAVFFFQYIKEMCTLPSWCYDVVDGYTSVFGECQRQQVRCLGIKWGLVGYLCLLSPHLPAEGSVSVCEVLPYMWISKRSWVTSGHWGLFLMHHKPCDGGIAHLKNSITNSHFTGS